MNIRGIFEFKHDGHSLKSRQRDVAVYAAGCWSRTSGLSANDDSVAIVIRAQIFLVVMADCRLYSAR